MEAARFITVAAGGHTLGVDADGRLWAWGRNSSDGGGGHGSTPVPDSGQLGHSVSGQPGLVQLPSVRKRLAALRATGVASLSSAAVSAAAGRYHSACATADGAVYTWGLNDQGQLGRGGTHAPRDGPEPCFSGATCRSGVAQRVLLPRHTRVVAVAAGRYLTLALSESGELFTWGIDGCASGQRPPLELAHSPRRVPFPSGVRIVTASVGYVHWLALDDSGRVWSCDTGDDGYAATLEHRRGANADGELGRRATSEGAVRTPGLVEGAIAGSRVIAVAAGRAHSLALAEGGRLWSWGNDQAGQLGRSGDAASPGLVDLGSQAALLIAAGEYFSLAALRGGGLLSWGANGNGQLGRGRESGREAIGLAGGATAGVELLSLAAGYQHAAAVIAAPPSAGDSATLVPSTGGVDSVPPPSASPSSFPAQPHSARRRLVEATSPDVFRALPPAGGSALIDGIASPCWRSVGNASRVTCLPLVHILGVSKCGTTDLYRRMARHPDFVESRNKGPHFWDECQVAELEPAPDQLPEHCSFDGYAALFDPLAAKVAAGGAAGARAVSADASSNTWTAAGVWRRGHSPKGDVSVAELLLAAAPYGRFVLILRDPVDRFFSAFHYYRRMFGPKSPSGAPPASEFHAEALRAVEQWRACVSRHSGNVQPCVAAFEPQQLIKGMYSLFLPHWAPLVGRDALLVMRLEDYSNDTKRHLQAVFRFVGLREPEPREWATILSEPRANAAASVEPMLDETRKLLASFYSPFNEELAAALGDNRFSWSMR